MARKTQVKQKSGMEGKFYIYIGSFVFFGSLLFFISMFGLDVGFVRLEGHISADMALVILALALLMEYTCDVRYCRAIRVFSDEKNSALDFIPLVNNLMFFTKPFKIATTACLVIFAFCLLIVVTPAAQLLPVSVLVSGLSGFVWTGVLSLCAILILRGIDQLNMKKMALKIYKELSGEFGSGAAWTNVLQSAFYFIPLIRLMNILSDTQFFLTVKHMLDLDTELE